MLAAVLKGNGIVVGERGEGRWRNKFNQDASKAKQKLKLKNFKVSFICKTKITGEFYLQINSKSTFIYLALLYI